MSLAEEGIRFKVRKVFIGEVIFELTLKRCVVDVCLVIGLKRGTQSTETWEV